MTALPNAPFRSFGDAPGVPVITQPPGTTPPDSGLSGVDLNHFVSVVYHDVLHRAAQQSEIDSWVALLNSGLSVGQMAQSFVGSPEYAAELARSEYLQLLGRPADPAGLVGWQAALQAGVTREQTASAMMGSDEYFNLHGATSATWLAAVYNDVLQRPADAAGLANWTQVLQAGVSRTAVASAIEGSSEAHFLTVTNAYEQFLRRTPDAPGMAGWGAGLNAGLPTNQLVASLLSSQEYINETAAIDPGIFVTVTGVQSSQSTGQTGGLTNGSNIVVSGVGTANTTFTLYVDDQADAAGLVSSQGTWSVALAQRLPQGVNLVAAQPGQEIGRPAPDFNFPIFVDQTPPNVVVSAPDFATTATPTVTVTATDRSGVQGSVRVDVDLNHDGQFTGPGEAGYASGNLVGGHATIVLPKLARGSYLVRASVADGAGNSGTSTPVTIQIDPFAGVIGSQHLLDLYSGYVATLTGSQPAGGSPTGPTTPGSGATPGGTQSTAKFLAAQKTTFMFDQANGQDRVFLNVRSTLGKYLNDLEGELKSLGMKVTFVAPSQNMITGYLPILRIKDLPSLAHFNDVTPVYRPMTQTGSVDTEGDAVIIADQFRATTGVDGTGVKVGVISDTINLFQGGIAASQATGDLPATVEVLEDGPANGATDEGRAMAEIVHDIAPGAGLAFHTGFNGPQDFGQGILDLQTDGARVINDDIRYADSPMFNDGVIALAADQVVANGSLYASAAGNSGSEGWMRAWSGLSNKSIGSGGNIVSGTFEDVGGGKFLQPFTLAAGDTTVLSFQWDSAYLEGGSSDPNFQVPNNLDIYVTDSTGQTILGSSTDVNQNTGEALEFFAFTNNSGSSNLNFAYRLTSGVAPNMLRWVVFSGSDPKAQDENGPTIFGQPAAASAVAVGAAPWFQPTKAEDFSSLGGALPFFFDAAGNRLDTPQLRIKPDITGPDGVSTTFFSDPFGSQAHAFFGTSAATPHVAGGAALMFAEQPAVTPADVLAHFQQTAIPIENPVPGPVTGPGLIQITPIPAPPPGGGGGGGAAPGDQFESNEVSTAATAMGTMAVGQESFAGLSIANHANGLSDFDWYKWTAGSAGTFTATTTTTSGGTLELHLFTVQGNTLVELTRDTTLKASSHTVTGTFAAGQIIFVEVKGANTSLGVWDQGTYQLDCNMV